MTDPSQQADLTSCDREPIHLLGRVQSFGCMIGLTSDWIVSCHSDNAAQMLGRAPDAGAMIAEPAAEVLGPELQHRLRNRIQMLRAGHGAEMITRVELPTGLFDLSLHVSGETIVLEFEPHQAGAADDAVTTVRRIIERVSQYSGPGRLFEDAAHFLQLDTGFDRVMFYRFLDDGTGEVIAEARAPGMESYMGLRYPASDIPRQARALYLRNTIRLIADSSDEGVPIRPAVDPMGRIIDLSGSVLRSVSPIHLQYLRNMGVAASMSISIIVDGKLWGLVACHHRTPLVLSQVKRNAAQLFGQMFSLVLQSKLIDEERRHDDQVRDLTAAIARAASSEQPVTRMLLDCVADFMPLLEADGVAVVVEGAVETRGSVPGTEEILSLARALNRTPAGQVYVTDHLAGLSPAAAEHAGVASGLLAIPVSRLPRDYILFFRRELPRKVTWAGNPDKPATAGLPGGQLSPRESFAAWAEEVRGRSDEWSRAQRRIAGQLRVSLLEVVLRLTDEASRLRKTAGEKQELLISELNHRVRNILGLVRGLVSQTSVSEISTAEMVAVLESRIQALARAHDQITRDNWAPASLRELVRVEAECYLLDRQDRVAVSGADVLLMPTAFSAVALVVHELMTNSAKYGSLSVPGGDVQLTIESDPDDALILCWTERGGPEVREPERRGFGSTIIERSVPFELQGEAEVAYRPEGLCARFWIPAVHVRPGLPSGEVARLPLAEAAARVARSPRRVLVLEDNLVIAMDAEGIFRDLGAENVILAASNAQASQHLRASAFDLALLDVNLGAETSFPFAEQLLAAGIPFAFASGYGEGADFPDLLRNAPRFSKPYNAGTIRKVLAQMSLEGRSGAA
ncbi:HWE histidine kinase domain-containing protein [Oceanicella sp. SM1341]|uniref:HWE histidine kinase domain-containing protein n=1 Tax=Oceanicella sp. SM1341 TaxID=1548889 RepID=UPI000E48B012|nr:HWE histidine kinase domain-containing protein [Oceanicella sp. SM1341]